MGLPDIEVKFKTLALSAIKRGSSGVISLIIKDTVPAINPIILTDVKDVVATLLTADNQKQINLAFLGGVNIPTKVIIYVLPIVATDYLIAQTYLETIKWNYLAIPEILETETSAIATWIKGVRDNMDIDVKVVLPNMVGDHEGVIDFATDGVIVGAITYTAAEYCGRIAGILAGTPLTMSATYQVLSEVTDVPHHTKAEFDALIDAGKLVLMNDGEKVKIARAVNSLTTLTADKGADFQKIKIIDIMDLIHDDIKSTYNDDYVGKIPNDYDHKCILITAINAYLVGLENQTLLDKNKNSVGIDTVAQKLYLQGKKIDVTALTDLLIKQANTGALVMLAGATRPLDAMEDLALNLTL